MDAVNNSLNKAFMHGRHIVLLRVNVAVIILVVCGFVVVKYETCDSPRNV